MLNLNNDASKSPSSSWWMEVPPLKGNTDVFPANAQIVVIGSGFTGASVGYFLNKHGFEDVVMVDYAVDQCTSFRNAGHILYGTVESMKAMTEIHGAEKAKELWQFSIDICEQIGKTIHELDIACDYRRGGYLVIASSEVEDRECRESVHLLNSMGFQSEYIDAQTIRNWGFKKSFGARYEKGSADAHPLKFRNGMVREFERSGGKYFSNIQVQTIEETSAGVEIKTPRGTIIADAVVIAANAYSPLFSDFFKGLVDPFRGQVLTSKPLKHRFQVPYAHSFDHGYEYAVVTTDNRLLLGGWRNHSPTGETGTYSLDVNPLIENGLKQFAVDHYAIDEKIEWEFSWSGIMAASRTGLPFIGPTSSPRIYACCGYTGHGFSWGHGSAKVLADIIAGVDIPPVSRFFNPKAAKN